MVVEAGEQVAILVEKAGETRRVVQWPRQRLMTAMDVSSDHRRVSH